MMGFVLQLFGGFRLNLQEGEPVGLTDRAQALLAYLAVAPSSVPRKQLAELLSEVGIEQDQRTAFRQTLYLARKATSEGIIVANNKSELALNRELVEADVRVFQSALTNDDRCSLRTTVELYRGPFLDGIKSPSSAFEDWLQARRAEFLECVLDALLKLASLDTAAGLPSSALAYARQALTLDPLREDAHRQVMCCLAALGQRTNALRQYEIARRSLAEELGVLPEAKTTALHDTIARGEGVKEGVAQVVLDRIAEGTGDRIRLPAFIGRLSTFARSLAALTITFPLIAGGIAAWYAQPPEPSSRVPSIAVLPFTNAGGSPAQNLGTADEIATMLSTHPGIQVVSVGKTFSVAPNAQQRYHTLGARYVLEGSVENSAGKMQVMVQLIDAATGDHLWADRLYEQGDDIAALEEQVAYRIYESIVGFSGEIERHEQRQAWLKSDLSLDEYDYARRGGQFYFQFTREAHAKARQIWHAGLAKFPNSAITRASLASLYRHAVEVGWSEHPDQDLNKAWQYGREASLTAYRSRYEEWVSHVLMAKLSQWCKEDFERSVAEAKTAVKLVPYDATIRADLAELMANAGKTDEAIEWLQESIKRDPKGPEWYAGNLAWAYYLAGRYKDALAELRKLNKPRPLLLSAVYIKLGRVDEAQAVVTNFLKKNPNYTIADAARWPLIASLKRSWLQDLRQAGLGKIRERTLR